MSTAQRNPDTAVLHDIDWATYTRLLRAFDKRRRFRLTYDRGTLEIMSPLWEHEKAAYVLGAFIDCLVQEFQMQYEPGRTVTLRRRRKSRGLEPDNCYWIASAGQLAGKTHLDLRVAPPPDLAIEVDVTSSSLDRMSIYAALGVPEVWRVNSEGLMFNVLESGVYQVCPQSLSNRHGRSCGRVDPRRTRSMKYILDASVAVKWVLPEPDSPSALSLEADYPPG